MRLARHIACMHVGYWSESKKERALEKPICMWVDNFKMDLRDRGWDGIDWTHLVQDMNQWRGLVSMVINVQIP
jgi:hypothetical protein